MRRGNKKDWFVLRTKARQEVTVLGRLSKLGIDSSENYNFK